jgi:hypothetical protein
MPVFTTAVPMVLQAPFDVVTLLFAIVTPIGLSGQSSQGYLGTLILLGNIA